MRASPPIDRMDRGMQQASPQPGADRVIPTISGELMGKEVGSSSHPKRYAQFFQNVVPRILEDGTLEVPEEIVREHGNCFSEYACLKVSTGKVWQVELKSCDGRVWLHKGWQEFVDECSVKCGHSLVFRYEGECFFQIFIFNTSGLEIEYPSGSVNTNQKVNLVPSNVMKIKEEDSVDDSSVGILFEWPQNTREAPMPNQFRVNDKARQGKGLVAFSAEHEVLQRARAFQSSNPHFIVIMRSAYQFHLYIPESPARIYFLGRDDKSIYLNGPDGRSWFMKYYIRRLPPYQVRINSGWSEFAQEYRLQYGDACIFELINSTVMAFKVTMYRMKEEEGEVDKNNPIAVREIPNPTQTGRRTLSDSAVLQCPKPLQCRKPSFTIVFKHSVHTSYTMCVPGAHASAYLLDQHEKEVFLHGLAGKTWPLKCYAYGKNFRFSSGWKGFTADNDVQEGDAGVFELISQAPNHYNVTIFRAPASAKPY